MQSSSVLPPPPGALGALSLGLPVPATPDPVLRCVLRPEEVDGVCRDGERGATGWTRCIGAPIADCGVGAWVVVLGEPLAAPPARCATVGVPATTEKALSTSMKVRRRRIKLRPTWSIP